MASNDLPCCPECGSDDVVEDGEDIIDGDSFVIYSCMNCNMCWTVLL